MVRRLYVRWHPRDHSDASTTDLRSTASWLYICDRQPVSERSLTGRPLKQNRCLLTFHMEFIFSLYYFVDNHNDFGYYISYNKLYECSIWNDYGYR